MLETVLSLCLIGIGAFYIFTSPGDYSGLNNDTYLVYLNPHEYYIADSSAPKIYHKPDCALTAAIREDYKLIIEHEKDRDFFKENNFAPCRICEPNLVKD